MGGDGQGLRQDFTAFQPMPSAAPIIANLGGCFWGLVSHFAIILSLEYK